MNETDPSVVDATRSLLRTGAARPTRDPDLPLDASLRPRRRWRGAAAIAAGLGVVIGAVALVALVPDSDGGTGTSNRTAVLANVPNQWATYRDDAGLTLRYPLDWQVAAESLTPYLSDPREVLSVGTQPLQYSERDCAQFPTSALEALGPTDAFLSLQERSNGRVGIPRPDVFTESSGLDSSETEIPACLGDSPDATIRFVPFEDSGRSFYAIVAVGNAASTERRQEPWQILNSLAVEPAS